MISKKQTKTAAGPARKAAPAPAAPPVSPRLPPPEPVAPPLPAIMSKSDRQSKAVELPDSLQRNVVLDTKQFAKLIGYSVPHLRRLYRAGIVPAPIQLNGRKMGWPVGVAQDFLAARQTAA